MIYCEIIHIYSVNHKEHTQTHTHTHCVWTKFKVFNVWSTLYMPSQAIVTTTLWWIAQPVTQPNKNWFVCYFYDDFAALLVARKCCVSYVSRFRLLLSAPTNSNEILWPCSVVAQYCTICTTANFSLMTRCRSRIVSTCPMQTQTSAVVMTQILCYTRCHHTLHHFIYLRYFIKLTTSPICVTRYIYRNMIYT